MRNGTLSSHNPRLCTDSSPESCPSPSVDVGTMRNGTHSLSVQRLCLGSSPDSCRPLSADDDNQIASSSDGLIPGLPDDLALYCLLRVPLGCQAIARTVCRLWNSALKRPDYFHARRTLGLSEQWLFVFAFHKSTGRIQWQALDPCRQTWHVVTAMPCTERVCPAGFGCAAVPEEGALYVCGGMKSDMDCPMDSVLKYELYRNRWAAVSSMSTPRSFFASGMIDGRIYAAGGNSTDCSLSSAEVYDPVDDVWQPVANMGANMARFDAAVLNGKLHLTEGWSWPFLTPPRGQIYDPKLNRWENMMVGMREGWTGLSVVLDGDLYIITDHEEHFKLKVYEEDTDSWKNVMGPPLPAPMSRPFSVNAMNGKLFVVAFSLHVLVGTVGKTCDDKKGTVFTVDWEVINAPKLFADFNPSSSQVLHA